MKARGVALAAVGLGLLVGGVLLEVGDAAAIGLIVAGAVTLLVGALLPLVDEAETGRRILVHATLAVAGAVALTIAALLIRAALYPQRTARSPAPATPTVATPTTTTPALADLAVELDGEGRIVVRNAGEADAGPFLIEVTNQDRRRQPIGGPILFHLRNGLKAGTEWTKTLPCGGTQIVEVDTEREVRESAEENNVSHKPCFSRQAPPTGTSDAGSPPPGADHGR